MDWRDDIIGIVDALRPTTVLAVMPADEPLWSSLARQARGCTRVSGTELLAREFAMRRVDLAIVAGTLEYMDKHEAGNVIAALRDLYSRVLYAAVPVGSSWPGPVSHWDGNELIAYGLRPARQYTLNGKLLVLCHYDIYDYKLTPDWLNSRRWANPHRWDKERW